MTYGSVEQFTSLYFIYSGVEALHSEIAVLMDGSTFLLYVQFLKATSSQRGKNKIMDNLWPKEKHQLIRMIKDRNEEYLNNVCTKIRLLISFGVILAVLGLILLVCDITGIGAFIGGTLLVVALALFIMTSDPIMDKKKAKEWETRFDILFILTDSPFIQKATKILIGRSVDKFEAKVVSALLSLNTATKYDVLGDDKPLIDEFLKAADKLGVPHGSSETEKRKFVTKRCEEAGWWKLIHCEPVYNFKEYLSCSYFEGLVDAYKGEPMQTIREKMLATIKRIANSTDFKKNFDRICQINSELSINLCQDQVCIQHLSQIIFGEDGCQYTSKLSELLVWLETEKSHVISSMLIDKTGIKNEGDIRITFAEIIKDHSDTFKNLFNEWVSNTSSSQTQADDSISQADDSIGHPLTQPDNPQNESIFVDFVLN